jgi:hypothetical protein
MAGWLGSIAALVFGIGLAQADDVSASPVEAEWRVHDTVMTYTGMTSLYSCDGLEWKLKLLLKAAGARSDAKVQATCSSGMGKPSRFVTARVHFATLALPGAPLAQGEKPDPKRAAPQPASGAWRAVRLMDRKPHDLEAGDCELVEQFDRELLPYFTTRDKVSHMGCIPHAIRMGGIDLSFEVLAAPLPAKVPATGK